MPFPIEPDARTDETESDFLIQDPFGLRRAITPVFVSDLHDGMFEGCGTSFYVTPFGHQLSAMPVRVVNDAAMQALGSYEGGKMLFLGLGTGLGSAMIVNGIVEPMELGHLPYKKGTYEDYVGNRGLERIGKKRWRKLVEDVVDRLVAALEPEDVVIGGGNVIHMKKLPRGCRAGNNAHAFIGGFRMWNDELEDRGTLARGSPVWAEHS